MVEPEDRNKYARKSDPQTSKEAAHSFKLALRTKQVLEFIADNPGCCGGEVGEAVLGGWKRTSELAKLRLIEYGDKVVYPPTGHRQETLYVTASGLLFLGRPQSELRNGPR